MNKNRAFTLMELLVAIAIIGILASLSMVVIARVREKGRETEARRQIRALVNAINEYHSDTGTYPVSDAVRTLVIEESSDGDEHREKASAAVRGARTSGWGSGVP